MLFAFFVLTAPACAQSTVGSPRVSGSSGVIPEFFFQIPIGGLRSIGLCETDSDGKLSCSGIATYIQVIYRFLVGFAAVLAVLALVWGGIRWLTSGGESGKIQEAQKIIGNSLIGLLIALGSYALLSTLGKQFVEYQPISIRMIKEIPFSIQPPDDPTVPGGGGTIAVSREGTPGRRCSGDEPTSLWKKVYSVPKEDELNNYILAEYTRRTGLPHEKALIGKGGVIIREAQKNGIDVGLALGVWMRESQWWGKHGYEGNYNIGDVQAKSCDPSIQCSIDYNPAACKNGACKAAGAGGVMTGRCMRCFTSIDDGIAAWMAYASRYSSSATIADALETYAPRLENETTCSGEYVDMVSDFISDMAKISVSGDVSDRVKQELGCGSSRTKAYISRTYDDTRPKDKCTPE